MRGRLTHALIGHGYDGRVYPVTRSQSEVLGLRAYATVAALPEPVDLAVILVPAAHVVETLEQCGGRGVRAAVIISSGFGEESNDAARARDMELRKIAERYGIVVCGPNSEGIVNPLRPLVATFSPVFHDPSRQLAAGGQQGRPIAVSCQSGALTFSFLAAAATSSCISPIRSAPATRPSSRRMIMSIGGSMTAAPISFCSISRGSAGPTASARLRKRRRKPASR